MSRPFLLSEQELTDVEHILLRVNEEIKKYLISKPISIRLFRGAGGRLSSEVNVASLPEPIAALTHEAIRGVRSSLNAMAAEIADIRGDHLSDRFFPFERLSMGNSANSDLEAVNDAGQALALLRSIVTSVKGGSGLSLIPRIDHEHVMGVARIVPSLTNVIVQGSYDLADPAIGDIRLVSYDVAFTFAENTCLGGHNFVDYLTAVWKAAGLIVAAFQRALFDEKAEDGRDEDATT